MRHDVKTALRTLGRHKGYALINVLGLALGVAACLLIGLYVREALAYDAFHANADWNFRLHRVPAEGSPIDAEVAIPMPAGAAMAAEFDVLHQKDDVRKTLGYLPQEFGVYPEVSAEDLLEHSTDQA